MSFDYKKEYKEFYLPPKTPTIVTVPAMNFLAVRGQGDPNQEDGAYKQALGMLYAVAYTIKMRKHKPEGYFDYVVPPLEGLWWQEGVLGVDYTRKADFQWISLIRLPEFVTREEFDLAIETASEKKQHDFSPVEFSPGKRACVSNVCTSAPMTMSPSPWPPWRTMPRPRAMRPTFVRADSITKSTSAMRGDVSPSG